MLDSLCEYLLSPPRAEEHNRMTNGVTAGALHRYENRSRDLSRGYSGASTCSRRCGRYTDSGNAIPSPLLRVDRSKLFSRKLQCPPRLAYHVPTSPMNYDSRDGFPLSLYLYISIARAMPSRYCNCNCISHLVDEREITCSLAYLNADRLKLKSQYAFL